MERTMVKLSDKVSLSPVVQGFWRLEDWNWSAKELAEFMNACIDRGVTTFDTAEIYSDTLCEKKMGEAFAADPSIRDRIQLVSKTGIFKEEIDGKPFGYYNTTYDRVKASCKESLSRLGTDHLDLYLIHREDPCFDPWETARALQDLKKEGLIVEAGVSNFDPFKFDALQTAMGKELVTNQIEWNPVCFEHFNSGMMDYLTVNRIHPMIWSPLAGGRLFGREDAQCSRAMDKIREIAGRHGEDPSTIVYAWLMYHPAGAIPISGSNKLARLDLALRALDVKLAHHEWYEIYTASGQQVLR
ncbi:MAG: aldo/keto reductase [Eubacteriales bacterium]|nr:aldo/keto reductase [Eubacteriales bacterium]